jgi:hypothetical protein
MWQLKSWVDPTKLSGFYISFNPNAIDYLYTNQDLINWDSLSQNEEAIWFLLENPNKINWHQLSLNPAAIHILAHNMSQINWSNLSKNPKAINILLHYHKHIHNYCNKYNFNQNPHPKAIQYFLDNPDEIMWEAMSDNLASKPIFEKYGYQRADWLALSKNPDVIDVLLQNIGLIYWPYFSINTSPKAIEYLKCNPDKIDWVFLSMNPAAEELILENLDKIDWTTLSKNPIIFEFNIYKSETVKSTQIYKEELIALAMHPDRIKKYLDAGYSLYDII